MNNVNIGDVFKTIGVPSITYVKRENGKYERSLKASLLTKGNLCLLTGPSKTGKTTLYNKVIKELSLEPLIIRCDNELTVEEFWKRALEKVNFERIKEKGKSNEVEGKIDAKVGWQWLIGELNLALSGKNQITRLGK